MAAMGKETGTCFGRGFDAGGLLGKFMAWVVKSPVNHGPGWYIIDDQSALVTNPYIVISDKSSPSANASRAKIIQVYLPTSTAGQVQFWFWSWWNTSTHVGVGPFGSVWHYGNLPTVDSGTFSYDFRGGPEFLFAGTLVGQSEVIDSILIDEWSYISEDFCEAESKIGTLQNPMFNESGDTGNQIDGYNLISGAYPNLDANGALYFSIVLRTGSTYYINIYKDSARTQLIGHTADFTNTATGAKGITADNSSGLGGSITLSATATATTSISCTLNKVTVGSGEGANFTVGNWYYITDFSSNVTTSLVRYVKVTSKSGDVLTIDATPTQAFPSGSLIGAYPHRFYVQTTRTANSASRDAYASTPYVSYVGHEQGDTAFNTNTSANRRSGYNFMTTIMSPGDSGKYGVMRPIIREVNYYAGNSTDMDREYGQAKNLFVGSNNGMSIYLQGRSIASKNYLYFYLTGVNAYMILDTEALS